MDAKHSLGEPRLIISRDALLYNAAVLRRKLQLGTKICAIVKANAYGHGVDLVVDTLYNFARDGSIPAIDMLAVASIDEAAQLPASSLPVIIFRPVENNFMGNLRMKIESAIRNGWVLTLCSSAAADDIARIALACGKRAAVQIMIDTGMTRSGCGIDDVESLLNTIAGHASLRLVGLGTHFAESENTQSPLTIRQIDRFRGATDEAMARLKGKVLRHAANSGAIFFQKSSHFDMVRPGIALFGIDPTFAPCLDRPLRPAMKWVAPLIMVRDVKKGTGVGYSQTWHANRDTRIGLIPVGYADGYLRCFGNSAVVKIHGQAVPVVGNVSMDSITVDLGDAPHATIGDEVTLLDNDPLSECSVYKLAKWADTIPYEIFCRIGSRVHRVPAEPEKENEHLPQEGEEI